MFDVILTISDLHAPYGHCDTIPFLKALKKKYFKKGLKVAVVLGGDEIDAHGVSFHDSDPDLMAPGDELEAAINHLKPIMELFPTAYILESNHGSLFYRKLKHHGIPRHVLKSYNQILEAPKGWKWRPELVLKVSNGQDVYFCHGKSSDVLKVSQGMSMNVVQFHFHEKFSISYWKNPNQLFWAAQAGCLIDDDKAAYAYNKLNLKRPIIGTVVIVQGQPVLEPMLMKNGRWTKKLAGEK
jgi:hypothetical protein